MLDYLCVAIDSRAGCRIFSMRLGCGYRVFSKNASKMRLNDIKVEAFPYITFMDKRIFEEPYADTILG